MTRMELLDQALKDLCLGSDLLAHPGGETDEDELICPGLVPAEDAKHIREILRTLREDEAQHESHSN